MKMNLPKIAKTWRPSIHLYQYKIQRHLKILLKIIKIKDNKIEIEITK